MPETNDPSTVIHLEYASTTTRTQLSRVVGIVLSIVAAATGAILVAGGLNLLYEGFAVSSRCFLPAAMAGGIGVLLCYLGMLIQRRLVLPAR